MPRMRFLMHTIVIAAVFLGSDHVANDGLGDAQGSSARCSSARCWNDVKTQNYHVAAQLRREAYTYRPGLVLARSTRLLPSRPLPR